MTTVVVGVDCATQEERTGLAYGLVGPDGQLELKRSTLGTAGESAPATIAGWLAGASRYVVAFGAPLGWPAGFGAALSAHLAGEPMAASPEQVFRRETDRHVQAVLGRSPPSAGGARIALTARAALDLLQRVRSAFEGSLPLTWDPLASGVIEVYPVATLLARDIAPGGYKADTSGGRKARARICERLETELRGLPQRELLTENGDLLDAVLCTLAAADFARGEAIPPTDAQAAHKEGWIWFRGRGQRELF